MSKANEYREVSYKNINCKMIKHINIFFLLIFMSCTNGEQKNTAQTIQIQKNQQVRKSIPVTYEKTYRFSLIGDFDGDGKKEELFQNNIDTKTGLSIDSFPNWDWENTIEYFYKKVSSEIIITCPNLTNDTLYLGSGFGLFRLINLGDLNGDNKDDFALAIENADFSQVNHCRIYSLINKNWKELKSFYIHEYAFAEEYSLKAIKGFLENKKGKWHYLDYLEDMEYENEKDVGKMKELKLPK